MATPKIAKKNAKRAKKKDGTLIRTNVAGGPGAPKPKEPPKE